MLNLLWNFRLLDKYTALYYGGFFVYDIFYNKKVIMIEYYRLIQRRDTEENWNSVNPILEAGEFGYDTTNNKIKLGDGVNTWNDLPFFTGGGGGDSVSWADITGKPNFQTVATSGSYNDLTDKPNIPAPANDGKLIIVVDGEEKEPFSADSSEEVRIDITTGGGSLDWFGTQEEYDALEEHDPSVIYHIEGGGGGNQDWFGTQDEYDALEEHDPSVIYHIEGGGSSVELYDIAERPQEELAELYWLLCNFEPINYQIVDSQNSYRFSLPSFIADSERDRMYASFDVTTMFPTDTDKKVQTLTWRLYDDGTCGYKVYEMPTFEYFENTIIDIHNILASI